jgi:predicted Zn-dependent protease
MSALLLLALAAAPISGDDDPILKVMSEEVKRAMTLTMPTRPGEKAITDKPYYARAYVVTEDTLSVRADFGALYSPGGGRRVQVQTQVRVGSPKLDNTNFQGSDFFFDMGGGDRLSTPAEEDPDAIRHRLWLEFDADFKAAVETLAKKNAYLKANEVKEVVTDFGAAPPEVLIEPIESRPNLSVERYSGIVKRASTACRPFPSPHTCTVALSSRTICQRMLASDGTKHRFCQTKLELEINAQAQAKDGMSVGWSWRALARNEAALPNEAELTAKVKEVGETLEKKVAAAGPQEDYTGPVLFTGDAAGQFFLASIAAPLLHPRASLGAMEQGRLSERLGKHIAVKQLQVTDDPNQQDWKSPQGEVLPLFGAYPVDDDGVRPKAVKLVQDGVLKTLFMSRNPTSKVPLTNGHARGSEAGPGNMFVSTTSPTPFAAMKTKLIELAQEEDLGYGLIVRLMGRQDMRGGYNGVLFPSPPLMVTRLYPDGHEEVVRGLTFKPASFRVLKDIIAMGDDPSLLDVELAGQPVSVVAPSVLVRTLELAKPGDDSKPPVLPRPKL